MAILTGPKIPIMAAAALGDPYLAQGNQMLRSLQALMQCNVIDQLTVAPSTPANGDTYIVGVGATGTWAGHENAIAYWSTQTLGAAGWDYYPPRAGWEAYNITKGQAYVFDGVLWNVEGGATADFMMGPGILNLAGLSYNVGGGWAGAGSNPIAFLKFHLLMNLPSFVLMDGSFGCNILAGENIALAIYDKTAAHLLWSSGALNIPNQSNIAMSFAIPPLSLSPDSYYLAWTSDAGDHIGCCALADPSALGYHSGTSFGNVINQSTQLRFGVAGNSSSSSAFPPTLAVTLAGGAALPSGGWNVTIPAVLFHN